MHVALGGAPVLRGVSVTVGRGEVVGLVGPNGAGKSTLLRVVTRLVEPAAGEVLIEGRALGERSRRELARSVAVVQQLPEALPTMRVRELVLLGRHPHLGLLARESGRDVAIAEEAMRRAGCLELARRELGTLSGGERRRARSSRAGWPRRRRCCCSTSRRRTSTRARRARSWSWSRSWRQGAAGCCWWCTT